MHGVPHASCGRVADLASCFERAVGGSHRSFFGAYAGVLGNLDGTFDGADRCCRDVRANRGGFAGRTSAS
ncbi:MAG: hypothetical protein ACXWEI_16795 [Mycobacterium sp.]